MYFTFFSWYKLFTSQYVFYTLRQHLELDTFEVFNSTCG